MLFSLVRLTVVGGGNLLVVVVVVILSVEVCTGRCSELKRFRWCFGAADESEDVGDVADDKVGGTLIGDGVLNVVAESGAARQEKKKPRLKLNCNLQSSLLHILTLSRAFHFLGRPL